MKRFTRSSTIAAASLASLSLIAGWGASTYAKGGVPAGGTLTIGQAVAITALSPQGFQPEGYPSGYEAAMAIYNGLVQFNNKLQIKPSLATHWSVSPNGRVWTFDLRRGVKFQDGTPFNAQAVVDDFRSMINPKLDTGEYVLWEPVTSIKALNNYTVQITTKTPYSALLDVLAHGSGLIPSPTAVKKWGSKYPLHPVGTGPFMMKSFQPGTQLTLTANPQYWGPKPSLKTLVFKYIPTSQSRIAALESGQVDVIDSVPTQNVAQLKASPNIRVQMTQSLQEFTIALNEADPALQSVKVRQALNYAVDKPAIIKALYDGYAASANSPLAGTTPGHIKSGSYPYSPSKATKLFAQAGWHKNSHGQLSKNGQTLSLTMLVPNDAYTNGTLIAQAIQSQLQQAGVTVKLDVVPTASFWGLLRQPAAQQTFQMALWGFNPSFIAGSLQMVDEFRSNPQSSANPPAIWNYIWYHNTNADTYIQKALETVNTQRSASYLGRAEKIVWDQAADIWLFTPKVIVAERSNVKGVRLLPNTFVLAQTARLK
jgi:ABC-type transport system substrate-binding protein